MSLLVFILYFSISYVNDSIIIEDLFLKITWIIKRCLSLFAVSEGDGFSATYKAKVSTSIHTILIPPLLLTSGRESLSLEFSLFVTRGKQVQFQIQRLPGASGETRRKWKNQL